MSFVVKFRRVDDFLAPNEPRLSNRGHAPFDSLRLCLKSLHYLTKQQSILNPW